jgi:hypothetical protein
MNSKWRWAGLGIIAVVSIAFLYRTVGYLMPQDLSRPALTESESVLGPAFSPSGQNLYFLKRNSKGMVSGPGIEFFTPPARVEFISDRISLVEMQVSTGQSSTVCTWEIPHDAQRVHFEYRGSIFGIVHSELNWQNESLMNYTIGADVLPDPPNLKVPEWKVGTWNPLTKKCVDTKDWDRAFRTAGPNEDSVSRDQEVFTYGFDQAIVSYFQDGHFRVYYDSLHRPDSVIIKDLRQALSAGKLQFNRERYERLSLIKNTEAELVRKFQNQGMEGMGAQLAAIDEMERLGYYPRPRRIAAYAVSSSVAGLSTIEIDIKEFKSGHFYDILAAVESPGQRIILEGDSYPDNPTSEKLNQIIGSGQKQFLVKISGEDLHKLSIERDLFELYIDP